MKKYTIFPLLLIGAIYCHTAASQSNTALENADKKFFSGTVDWIVDYEVFTPNIIVEDIEFPNLSQEAYLVWKEKQKGYRYQRYYVQSVFKDNYVVFNVVSEPGDIAPTFTDYTLAYDGVSFTVLDHVLKDFVRTSTSDPFIDSMHANFHIAPRFCGYDYPSLIRQAREVRDVNGQKPLLDVQQDLPNNKIKVNGKFTQGTAKLVEVQQDSVHKHVMSMIKFIKPKSGEKVVFRNQELKEFNNGVVFPNQVVRNRFFGGSLDDEVNVANIDKMTLTLVSASFNENYPDSLFNPSCPEGYKDLNQMRDLSEALESTE